MYLQHQIITLANLNINSFIYQLYHNKARKNLKIKRDGNQMHYVTIDWFLVQMNK